MGMFAGKMPMVDDGGMFGGVGRGYTPPAPMPDMPIGGLMQPPGAPSMLPKPGFFQQGGLGSRLIDGANSFAKSYLALDGNQGAMSELESQRALQHAQILRQQSLQDDGLRQGYEFQRQLALKQYELANKPPPELADRVEYLNKLKPGLGDTYASNYALYGGSQPLPQMMNIPGVGVVAIPRTSSAAPAAPQTAPPGVTFTPIPAPGGAGPQTPPTFRSAPRTR